MSDDIFDDQDLENDLPASDSELEPESIGETSDENQVSDEDDSSAGTETENDTDEEESKKKPAFSVFDALLLISLVCVTLATLLLVLELRRIDASFPFSFPWRTSEVLNVLMPW